MRFRSFCFGKEQLMPRYFMRDTPLRAMERLMMSQPGHKPRCGGTYRSQFHYTPKDVECEYCQNYVRKNPCLLCECTCLEERIEAGVLNLSEFVRDCFAPSMEQQLQERMRLDGNGAPRRLLRARHFPPARIGHGGGVPPLCRGKPLPRETGDVHYRAQERSYRNRRNRIRR